MYVCIYTAKEKGLQTHHSFAHPGKSALTILFPICEGYSWSFARDAWKERTSAEVLPP